MSVGAPSAAATLPPLQHALIRAMPWLFVLIWSTGFVVARFAMPHAPPLKFLVLRYALSLGCFGVWIVAARVPWPRDRVQWLHLGVVGILIQAAYLGGVWTAVKGGIGAGTVALLVGLQPVLTAFWTAAVSGRSGRIAGRSGDARDGGDADTGGISARQWLGLALGLAGLTLVVWHKLGGGEVTPTNLAFALVALLGITAGTLYQKRFVAPCDVRTASAVQLLAALAVTLPLAAFEATPIDWQPQALGALLWSVLVLTLGGSSLLYLLIQRGAATEVTSLMYLVPPCTALLAWWLFGEAFTPGMALGLVLTAAGVAMVVRR